MRRIGNPVRLRSPRLVILVCGLLMVLFCLRQRYFLALVDGESMLPTLRNGDLMVVDKFAYRRTQPKRGDIIVADYEDGMIVKRIVGLPGEKIEVNQGCTYVNGLCLKEDYSTNA